MTGISPPLTREDLIPRDCEAVELSWHDDTSWLHCFAVPSSVYPGRWHAGCAIRRSGKPDKYAATDAPIRAVEVAAFFARHQPCWTEGKINRWSTNGLPENPAALPGDFSHRLFVALRSVGQ